MRGPMLKPRKPTLYAERDAALHRQDELQAATALANQRRDQAVLEADTLRAQLADCCPELTARYCALMGLSFGVPLGYLLGVLL